MKTVTIKKKEMSMSLRMWVGTKGHYGGQPHKQHKQRAETPKAVNGRNDNSKQSGAGDPDWPGDMTRPESREDPHGKQLWGLLSMI